MSTSIANSPISRRNLLRRGAFTVVDRGLSPALLLGEEDTSQCPRHCSRSSSARDSREGTPGTDRGKSTMGDVYSVPSTRGSSPPHVCSKGQSPFAAISCSDSRVPPG